MSKKEKLLQKLCKKPAPKDFAWDELITVLERAGFSAHCEGGSHYTFQHSTGYTFGASKTHPGGILKRYQINNTLTALRAVGVLGEDNHRE